MKSEIIEFYVEKFEYIKSSAELNLDFIPSLLRRRLGSLDKIAVYSMNKCMSDDIENIVFASENGEVERLVTIIEQYLTLGEVSPAIFSGSVHNYPIGVFLRNSHKSVPYTALAACQNTISSGLLSCLVSNYNKLLFCYADKNGDDFYSFALKISKNFVKNSQKYILKSLNNFDKTDKFDDYIKFFIGEKSFLDSYIFRIERIGDV